MSKLKYDYTAWVEIDQKAIRSNFRAIKQLTRKREVEQRKAQNLPTRNIKTPLILAVIKADAYGHGMVPVAKELVKCGVDFLGVSEVSEGIALREAKVKKSILVLEPPLSSKLKSVVKQDFIATVCTYKLAKDLSACAKKARKTVDVHIKVDTGMGRLGVPYDEAASFIQKMMRLPNISIKGLYTHFPVADTNKTFTQRQINQMQRLVHELDQQGLVIPYIHGANSMGIAGYPTRIFNVARPGLMLYGLYPAPGCEKELTLKPVMNAKACVVFIKEILKGQGVSYGRTFVAKKKMKVATVAIGYNDGYLRALSNKASVFVGGKSCPILGRVTMDQIVVDVSRVKNIRIGQEVELVGKNISADELAKHAGTINYEIVCSLGNRLPRVYKN